MYDEDKKCILQYINNVVFLGRKGDEDILSKISVKNLIWLSENFRSWQWDAYSWHNWDIDLDRSNFLHLSDNQYNELLKLGTFMADGYTRQWCMELLKDTKGALPFLILRLNDWVAPIRERAFVLARQRINQCLIQELVFALPMFEKVTYAKRRDENNLRVLKDQIEQVIQQKFCIMTNEELDMICHYEILVRNAIYRFVNQNRVLTQTQMERLLCAEKTGYGKRLLIKGIFAHYGYDRGWAEKYLASRSSVVRYCALLHRYEVERNAWNGLETMLLDPSKRIREYAGYILTKREGMDITAYYLQECKRCVSKTVLLGIGENGTKQEIAAVVPYLESQDEQICKAALIAYGNLAAESGEAVYWRFLSGSNPILVRQAYRLIRKYQISYNVQCLYHYFMQNQRAVSGEYFLYLLLCASSWQRLPYLLVLYCDTAISEIWRSMILSKICERNPYARLSKQQAQEICDILEQNQSQIPQEVDREIRFDLRYVTK